MKTIVKQFLAFALFFIISTIAHSQTSGITSSKLPICIIDTRGITIVDEPKITANFKIIYNGEGKINYVTDKSYHYNNAIGIEKRGNSSQSLEQLQYGIETRDSVTGNNLNVSLLGMPADNDWVLYAPYNDISMLRNVMAYHLWDTMGHWAPRTRMCELILNGSYQGIYVLMENIKQGSGRIDVAKLKAEDISGLDLTGGYIMKIDAKNNVEDKSFTSKVAGKTTGFTSTVTWLYHYPKSSDILPQQEQYIRSYIDTVETLIQSAGFADPKTGYAKYISTQSFIDYFIHTELSKNADGYKRSAYFYKEKLKADGSKGKLKAGSVWDYNLAYGNVKFCGGNQTRGWVYQGCETLPVPALWERLLQDPNFINAVKCRYKELRNGILSEQYLNAFIDKYALDTLQEAQARHFTKYPSLLFPNGGTEGGFGGSWAATYNAYRVPSYSAEIDTLKRWLKTRLAWMDNNLGGTCNTCSANITTGGSVTFCQGESVALTASTGTSYIWKNGSSLVGTSQTYNAFSSGSYTVEVTDEVGCKASSAAAFVTVNSLPPAPAVSSHLSYCQNVTASALTATGTSLKWYTDATDGTGSANAPLPVTTTAGSTNYYVSQTTNGCESTRSMIVVTINDVPQATLTANGPTTFEQGEGVLLSANTGADLSYQWFNGTNQVGTTSVYTAVTGGTYTVDVTNASGCKTSSLPVFVTVIMNQAPSINITAPTANAVFIAPAQIRFEAMVGDADGTVTKVDFYNGTVLLGTDASSPYEFVWTNQGSGSYIITALATDNMGAVSTSSAININVYDNLPSVILITSPIDNSKVNNTVEIHVSVTDPDGSITKVEFLDGTNVIGTSSTEPYSFIWDNPTPGNHVIMVRVTDSNGGVTTSSGVTVTTGSPTGIYSGIELSSNIYPVPSTGVIHIETGIDLATASVKIVDGFGAERIVPVMVNGNNALVDLSSLASGIYTLVINQDEYVIKKKITLIR